MTNRSSTSPKKQSLPKYCLDNHETNQICSLKEHREGCWTFTSPSIPKSSTKIKSPKCLGQCNQIQAKPHLVFPFKQSALVDDKCKETYEIGLPKPVSLANGTVLNEVVQNAGEAGLPYHYDLTCSLTDVSWSPIDLSLAYSRKLL
ncbi:hypothetical protein ACTXT7_001930 [Hymenolepis weldensis]